jgi:hypothetical protein
MSLRKKERLAGAWGSGLLLDLRPGERGEVKV